MQLTLSEGEVEVATEQTRQAENKLLSLNLVSRQLKGEFRAQYKLGSDERA